MRDANEASKSNKYNFCGYNENATANIVVFIARAVLLRPNSIFLELYLLKYKLEKVAL